MDHEASRGLTRNNPVRRPAASGHCSSTKHRQMLPIQLDRASHDPLYRQIEVQIRDSIRDGRLHLGTKVPGIRTFANQLGVARITVATAYDNLAASGYLIGRTGAGAGPVRP